MEYSQGGRVKYLLILLMGCASPDKVSEWTKGCMVGIVDNYQRISGKEWSNEHTSTLYFHCTELENAYGKDN